MNGRSKTALMKKRKNNNKHRSRRIPCSTIEAIRNDENCKKLDTKWETMNVVQRGFLLDNILHDIPAASLRILAKILSSHVQDESGLRYCRRQFKRSEQLTENNQTLAQAESKDAKRITQEHTVPTTRTVAEQIELTRSDNRDTAVLSTVDIKAPQSGFSPNTPLNTTPLRARPQDNLDVYKVTQKLVALIDSQFNNEQKVP